MKILCSTTIILFFLISLSFEVKIRAIKGNGRKKVHFTDMLRDKDGILADHSVQIEDLPPMDPCTVRYTESPVYGKRRRDMPGLTVRFKSSAFKKTSHLFFGMVFGENRWKKLLPRLLPTSFDIDINEDTMVPGVMRLENLKFTNLVEPLEKNLNFVDGKIVIDVKGMDFEFDLKASVETKSSFLHLKPGLSSIVNVRADKVDFRVTLTPYFKTIDIVRGKKMRQFFVNVDEANLSFNGDFEPTFRNTLYHPANFLIAKFDEYGRESFRNAITTRMVAIIQEKAPPIAEMYANAAGITIASLADSYLMETYKVSMNLKENFKFYGQEITAHQEYLKIDTDVILDYSYALGGESFDPKALEYFITPRPVSITMPVDQSVKAHYFQCVKYKKTLFDKILNGVSK